MSRHSGARRSARTANRDADAAQRSKAQQSATSDAIFFLSKPRHRPRQDAVCLEAIRPLR